MALLLLPHPEVVVFSSSSFSAGLTMVVVVVVSMAGDAIWVETPSTMTSPPPKVSLSGPPSSPPLDYTTGFSSSLLSSWVIPLTGLLSLSLDGSRQWIPLL